MRFAAARTLTAAECDRRGPFDVTLGAATCSTITSLALGVAVIGCRSVTVETSTMVDGFAARGFDDRDSTASRNTSAGNADTPWLTMPPDVASQLVRTLTAPPTQKPAT